MTALLIMLIESKHTKCCGQKCQSGLYSVDMVTSLLGGHNSPPWYQRVVSATLQSGRYDPLTLKARLS